MYARKKLQQNHINVRVIHYRGIKMARKRVKEMIIDYKELLKKYMLHIEWEDGSTFVRQLNDPHSDIKFTDKEKSELEKLSKELDK